jgi:hypothetical protein
MESGYLIQNLAPSAWRKSRYKLEQRTIRQMTGVPLDQKLLK